MMLMGCSRLRTMETMPQAYPVIMNNVKELTNTKKYL